MDHDNEGHCRWHNQHTSTPAHQFHTIPFGNMMNGGGARDMSCLEPGYVFFFLFKLLLIFFYATNIY